MKFAVIPARSGSVELPNKNLQVVCRKSLLNRAIDFAIEADLFDKVIVTTDYSTHLFQNDRVDVHHRPESLATSQIKLFYYNQQVRIVQRKIW